MMNSDTVSKHDFAKMTSRYSELKKRCDSRDTVVSGGRLQNAYVLNLTQEIHETLELNDFTKEFKEAHNYQISIITLNQSPHNCRE